MSTLIHEVFSSTKHRQICLLLKYGVMRLFIKPYSLKFVWDMCTFSSVRVGVALKVAGC